MLNRRTGIYTLQFCAVHDDLYSTLPNADSGGILTLRIAPKIVGARVRGLVKIRSWIKNLKTPLAVEYLSPQESLEHSKCHEAFDCLWRYYKSHWLGMDLMMIQS